ncbi:MAG: glycosyltransferase [Bacteroidales bacterium]|jgi:glycosyltransferase involved in cell wall biosynthesis|nr:glycosyltransferase [Bacteroidales bacterium]
MKISIITVCYNSEKYIRSAIESVLRQTYENIEYVVVDGGSTDSTRDIIKEYAPQFNGRMRWISEPDNGIYDAMNKGIKMATGDVIGILNSDDVYFDDKVIEDIILQVSSENVDSIYGNIIMVHPDSLHSIIRIWKSSAFKPNSFRKGWHPPHPAFFVRKKVYDNFGIFDTSFDISADFELMLRFLEKQRISTMYYDRMIVKMRTGGESTGSVKRIIRGNRGVVKAFKKHNMPVSILYPFYRLVPKLLQFIR